MTTSFDDAMRLALTAAREAATAGEVPVGAVLLDPNGAVVATDHNRGVEFVDPTAHAEMLVLRKGASRAADWRLNGHTLVVTLEPCAMCAMAAVWARVDRIVYGASDLKAGAAWSLYNIPQDARLNHRCELVSGVLAAEASALLAEFFAARRD
ncbi:MAG: tRNA adenosine(34) deaminase TadA [Actinomycetota bacterium]